MHRLICQNINIDYIDTLTLLVSYYIHRLWTTIIRKIGKSTPRSRKYSHNVCRLTTRLFQMWGCEQLILTRHGPRLRTLLPLAVMCTNCKWMVTHGFHTPKLDGMDEVNRCHFPSYHISTMNTGNHSSVPQSQQDSSPTSRCISRRCRV